MTFRPAMTAMAAALSIAIASPLQAADDGAQKMIDDLRVIVDKARKERAADRWLLRDLEDLLARHDYPWRNELFYEDFRDGDYSKGLNWQVLSGQFDVYREGLSTEVLAERRSASSQTANTPARQEDMGALLLGALLESAMQGKQRQEPSKPAEPEPTYAAANVRLKHRISNAFALESNQRWDVNTQLSWTVAQGSKTQYGYRLSIDTTGAGRVELNRIRKGRDAFIEEAPLPKGINLNRSHDLIWRQAPDGNITVMIDDTVLFNAYDKAYKDDYHYLTFGVEAGRASVRNVKVEG